MNDAHDTRRAVIMAADIAGYTRLVAQDAAGTVNALRAHRAAIIDPGIARHSGRIANTAGDSLLVEFAAPSSAVACCVEMQQAMAARNRDLPPTKRIEFRIGLHIGHMVDAGADMLGEGVNMAARIEAQAEPGGIAMSEAFHAALAATDQAQWQDTGQQWLKNVAHRVRIWRWVGRAQSDSGADAPFRHHMDRKVIAVLPFEDLTADPDQTHFASGLAEDLILLLSKVQSLSVLARNTTFTLDRNSNTPRDLARDLGASHVVDGSVRKAGNRVRISVQLVDAATAETLWSDRYDRDLTDVFAIQDEVTAEVAEKLSVRLTRQDRHALSQDRAVDLVAYDLFHRARELMYRTNRADNAECRRILTEALDRHPDFASALAYLSMTYVMDHVNGWTETPGNLVTAARHAEAAVEADDTEALAHLAVGTVALWLRDHDRAIDASARATRLNPSYAHAFFHYGSALTYAGRPGEALPHFETAKALDPRHADVFLHWQAQAHFHLRDFDGAAAILTRRLTRNPNSDISRLLLASCHGFTGRPDLARDEWRKVLDINPAFSLAQKRAVLPYRSRVDFGMIEEGLALAGIAAT